MKIPTLTKRPRYYVAVHADEALSSWPSLETARACVRRCRRFLKAEARRICAVVRVDERRQRRGGRSSAHLVRYPHVALSGGLKLVR